MKYRNIAIIKLSSLGDIVHTLPAFSILRKQFPDSKITWFAEPTGAELLENFSGIDEIVPVDVKSGNFLKRLRNLKDVLSGRRGKFDIIIDFQGLIKSAALSRLLGKHTAGFNKRNLREGLARFFYKYTSKQFNETDHVIRKNIFLLSIIGLHSEVIVYPLRSLSFSKEADRFMKDHELEPGKYVILNTGGGWESKLLSADQNKKILNDIDQKFKKVVLWGNGSEERSADMISGTGGIIKAPFFDFTDLIVFISNAGFLISSDSLPLHIADITGTRSVGVFGPTSPKRNGTLNAESISVVNEIDCSYCYKRRCSHKSCIENIDLSVITEFINRTKL